MKHGFHVDISFFPPARHASARWRTEVFCLKVTQDHLFLIGVSKPISISSNCPEQKDCHGFLVSGIPTIWSLLAGGKATVEADVARSQCGGPLMLLCAVYVTSARAVNRAGYVLLRNLSRSLNAEYVSQLKSDLARIEWNKGTGT
jgi:hypothetical protein